MKTRIRLQESEIDLEFHLLEEIQALTAPRGRLWRVCVIREGWSKNNRFYPRQTLIEAVSLFEGCPIAAYETDSQGRLLDHLKKSGRVDGEAQAGNNAGLLSRAAFEENGPDGPGIYADYHCTEAKYREAALAAHDAKVECPFGLSIDGEGEVKIGLVGGRRGPVVTKIHTIFETTLVSNPAAGSRRMRLVASVDQIQEAPEMKGLKKFLKSRGQGSALEGKELIEACAAEVKKMKLKASNVMALQATKSLLAESKEEEAAELLEALIEELEEDKAPAAAAVTESVVTDKKDTQLSEAHLALARVEAIEKKSRKNACKAELNSQLGSSQLPEKFQTALREQYEDLVEELEVEKFSEKLTESIVNMRSAIAAHVPQSGAGSTGAKVLIEPTDRLRAGIEMLWTGRIPEGIAESKQGAYRDVLRGGRHSFKGLMEWAFDCPVGQEAGPNALTEAVSGQIPYILGTSMNKRVYDVFTAMERDYDAWLTFRDDVTDFKPQDIIVEHNIGRMPSVGESAGDGTASYSYGNIGGEDRTSASIGKFGMLIGITREMMKNDEMRRLQRLPERLAKSAFYTEKYVVLRNLIANGGGGGLNTDLAYTGKAVYHAHHGNIGQMAFSYAAMVAAAKRRKAIREWGIKTTLTSGINSSTTTIPVANTKGYNANDQFRIDGETFRIQTVDSATQFTVASRSGTGASHSSGAAVRQLLDQVQISKTHLVVPTDLLDSAIEVMESNLKPDTANNNGNALKRLFGKGGVEIHDYDPYFLGDSTTAFYLPSDRGDAVFQEVAWMDGVRAPQVFVAEDQALSSNMLQADQITFKGRAEFYVATVEPRACDGNNCPVTP